MRRAARFIRPHLRALIISIVWIGASFPEDGWDALTGPMYRGVPISVSGFLVAAFLVGSLFGMVQFEDKRLVVGRWKLRVPVEWRQTTVEEPKERTGLLAGCESWLSRKIAEAEDHTV